MDQIETTEVVEQINQEPIIENEVVEPIENETEVQTETETKEVEPWMEAEEEGSVPVKTHIGLKQKLKANIREKEAQLADAETRNEAMQRELNEIKRKMSMGNNGTSDQHESLKAPNWADYETDQDYDQAMSEYVTAKANKILESRLSNDAARKQEQDAMAIIDNGFDDHIQRVEALVHEAGIDPDMYIAASNNIKKALDSFSPGKGNVIYKGIFAKLGKESEKVEYYLGRNEGALNKFIGLLKNDSLGIEAIAYLGEIKATKAMPKKIERSKAPDPPPTVKGDTLEIGDAKAARAKFNMLWNVPGKFEEAYEIKKAAKKKGYDVSGW